MQIPPYQIHNILNVYSRKLIESDGPDKEAVTEKYPNLRTPNITNSGKRQVIMKKITAQIFESISAAANDAHESQKAALPSRENHESPTPFHQLSASHTESSKKTDASFTYMVIDEKNMKSIHTFEVKENSIRED